MTDIAAAAERVSNFLANHDNRTGVDVEQIITVHAVPELEPGVLLAADLRLLVDALSGPEPAGNEHMRQLVRSLRTWKLRWVRTDGGTYFASGRSGSVVVRAPGYVELLDTGGNLVGDSFIDTESRCLYETINARFGDRDALAATLASELEPF